MENTGLDTNNFAKIFRVIGQGDYFINHTLTTNQKRKPSSIIIYLTLAFFFNYFF